MNKSFANARLWHFARIAALSSVLAFGATCFANTSAKTSPIKLRIGIGLKIDSPQGQAMAFFSERVAAGSNGRITFEILDNAKAGDELSAVNAVSAGTLDMTCPDSATLAKLIPAFSAINYPFTFFNDAEVDAVLDGPWGQRLLEKLPANGMIGLAFWENGFRNLTNSKRPIHSSADFNGIRLRVMQNQMLVDSFKHVGFDTVPLPFTKVYESLKTHAIDGQENPLSTIWSMQLYQVQPYLTLSKHVYSAFVVLISRRVWDGLAPADQRLIQQAMIEARDHQRRLNRDRNRLALQDLRAAGVQVSDFPREEAERIRARMRPVLEQYNQQIGPNEVIRLYIELSRFRALGQAGMVSAK